MERILPFIDNEWVEPASGRFLDNAEPATGATYSLVADCDERDAERAVLAAERAFPDWSGRTALERSRLLLRLADLVERDLEALARAESIDTGKPLALARGLDIPRAVANLRFFATAILHARDEMHATDREAINYTLRRPRGVAACISPWNLPLYLLTWKVAPALATGNTVVAKPSELTPMTAHLLTRLAREAGLPPGVLNVLHGQGAHTGAPLVRHPRVATITFTGGTRTGAEIARTAGPLFKRMALELGGKNPNVICADADLEQAVPTSVRAAFWNQGQICLAGSRLFVEEPIFERFVERFVDAARGLRMGDPLDPATEQGALVSRAHLDKVAGYVALARAEGARVACGGGPPAALPERCRGGWFHEPTVLLGVALDSRVQREEIFGPVVTVTSFRGEDELVSACNDSEYGLAASIFTADLDRAHRLAERVQSGTVWVNCWLLRDLRVPFGGMRASGVGREGGEEALHFFTEPKNVCVRVGRAERR